MACGGLAHVFVKNILPFIFFDNRTVVRKLHLRSVGLRISGGGGPMVPGRIFGKNYYKGV